ncbi:hypothetical protein MYAM1_000749 [Malassezia yamatoensis]|uniref:SYO1-like TPR repeats domain-containing protein n=1 Tax=Malassezia yamatoensis TaxID=253288 RepID=A0AAJ5YPA1_9BASI|nr:hypothetical protein MYAM1_000749 [Malassezia yamatoensis]
MPKSRRDWGARQARHDPLRRTTPIVSEVKAEVVPVLGKLPESAGETIPPGEQVWALASISSLLEDENADRNRRMLLSKNVIKRIIFALESNTDLEIRREASGALRNLCVNGDTDVLGEIANKGGIEAVLNCLRWATMGLQNQQKQLERAQAPLREARERLLSKPMDQMNRKERRQAAKLQAGTIPDTLKAQTDFAPDPASIVEVHEWAADVPQQLLAMEPAAATCLVETCENLVVILGCVSETSEKLLVRVVRWDWHCGNNHGANTSTSPFAGEALAAWLCEAIAVGTAPEGPYAGALQHLATSSANTLCALCDDTSYGLAKALVGLPSDMPSSKKARRADRSLQALPTPSELLAKRTHGSSRLTKLAQAVQLVPMDGEAHVNAALGVITSGALCNILQSIVSDPEIEESIVINGYGPLQGFAERELLPRLTHILSLVDTSQIIRGHSQDALYTCELSLEIITELVSMLGVETTAEDHLCISGLPIKRQSDDEADFEMLEDQSNTSESSDRKNTGSDEVSEENHGLDHWIFAQLLQSALLPVLLKLASPTQESELDTSEAYKRRAVEVRAMAAVNNLLLRLALFAPPPPSQWPSDESTLECITAWRTWVGTSHLEGKQLIVTPTYRILQETWNRVFAIASHWASVPSVVDADSCVSGAWTTAAKADTGTSLARDGIAMVNTCIGGLWSIARILEGQLPLISEGQPAPYVTALQAAYQSARIVDVRVKCVGTLAVLARSQVECADSNPVATAYQAMYLSLGSLLVDVIETSSHDPDQAELLVVAINGVIDTYANELAPWNFVYEDGNFQTRLSGLITPITRVIKRMDKSNDVSLYTAAKEALDNLKGFLEYRTHIGGFP